MSKFEIVKKEVVFYNLQVSVHESAEPQKGLKTIELSCFDQNQLVQTYLKGFVSAMQSAVGHGSSNALVVKQIYRKMRGQPLYREGFEIELKPAKVNGTDPDVWKANRQEYTEMLYNLWTVMDQFAIPAGATRFKLWIVPEVKSVITRQEVQAATAEASTRSLSV